MYTGYAASGGPLGASNMTEPQLRIFINYRREDTWGEAMLLHERLANRFASKNVFLDVRSLQPGMKWLKEIMSQDASSAVFLSLIGPRWLPIMKERLQAISHPTEDYVLFEIEYALRQSPEVRVIPVLVGDAVPFTGEGLPPVLQALMEIEAEQVRPKRFDEDLAHLIQSLEEIASGQRDPPTVPAPNGEDDPPPIVPPPIVPLPAARPPIVPPPDAAHLELVLQHMVNEGNLVPFLGSRLTGKKSDPLEGPRPLPNADEIAAYLAERSGADSVRPDLPVVAQYVYLTKGRPDLYRAVGQILTADYGPGPVHQFLARFPGRLKRLRADPRYQLIVTTNFDTALEQAFKKEDEPYDLAVYMASGPDKGKFVHFPYDGFPEAISIPNAYGKFPIRDYGELERTLIVKIHGAVDGSSGGYRWKENYVITEDHYIDYLSRSPIESLVPVQILDKLRDSHVLFLGYTVREWNLRVFLQRIWRGEPLGAKSWAIEPEPDGLEKEFWAHSNVDLYAAGLAEYVRRLEGRLDGLAQASA
jgi:SIR2-like domain/TIR domain